VVYDHDDASQSQTEPFSSNILIRLVNAQTSDYQPLILAVETATRAGGVALARGETILASAVGDASVSHSTNLIEMIEQVLRHATTNLSDVDLFAVAIGPGSFTGLRIGLATAKAFGVHLRKKVAGVSTLAAVAHTSQLQGQVISLLPAGRGEVFAQQFAVGAGQITELDHAQHLSPRAVLEKYGGVERLVFAGEARMAEASFGVPPLAGIAPPGSSPEGDTQNRAAVLEKPLAPAIAVLGYRAYRAGKSIAPEDLHAAYVRASDAEINEQWQQLKARPQG
jgi:tRNA threonylcarbamoyladenosine biosynthesis protein TsaB